MLCCDILMFVVKQGVPSDEDLERLSQKLEKWKTVGRHLEIVEARLTAFDMKKKDGLKKSSKGYYISKRGRAQLQHSHKTLRISRLTPPLLLAQPPFYKPHITQSVQRGANVRI